MMDWLGIAASGIMRIFSTNYPDEKHAPENVSSKTPIPKKNNAHTAQKARDDIRQFRAKQKERSKDRDYSEEFSL